MFGIPITHEFSLGQFIHACFNKQCAQMRGLLGSHLDLPLNALPSVSTAEEVVETLDRLSRFPALQRLTHHTRELFSDIYYGLLIPDLDERHRLLTAAHDRLNKNLELKPLRWMPVAEHQALGRSWNPIDQVKAELITSVMLLDWCLQSAMTRFHPEPRVEEERLTLHLRNAVAHILEADSRSAWDIGLE